MAAKEPKEMFSARISRVVKDLIRAERETRESDGAFLERLVLSNITTEQGRQIVSDYAQRDPLARAVMAFPKSGLVAVN